MSTMSQRGYLDPHRSIFYDQAGAFTPLVSVVTSYGSFLCRTGDQLGKSLYVNGLRPEMWVLNEAINILNKLGTGESVRDRIFIDGGANNGTATIAGLLRHGFAKAVAIEPEPSNYRLLCMNLIYNGLSHRTAAVEAALSDTIGMSRLTIRPEHSGENFLTAEDEANVDGNEDLTSITVATVTLDQLATEGLFDPDQVGMVWLDVQGCEVQAMRGATALMSAGVPTVLEFWPEELRSRDVLGNLAEFAETYYTHVADLREPGSEIGVRPSKSLMTLAERLDTQGPGRYSDILLLRLGS